MTYLAYTAAPIENNVNNIIKKINKINKKGNINKETRFNLETNLNTDGDDDTNDLYDYKNEQDDIDEIDDLRLPFNPPPPSESIGVNKTKELDNKIVRENYKNLPDLSHEQYKQKVNYYDNASGVNTTNNDLITKLNYMIKLLEEEKDIKQNTVTEELILYLFLGIFIIFIIDSFARASKYVR